MHSHLPVPNHGINWCTVLNNLFINSCGESDFETFVMLFLRVLSVFVVILS